MQGNNAAAIAPGRLIRRLDPRTKLALLPHGLGMSLPEHIHI